MKPNRQKLGKMAQKKGKYYNDKSCKYWSDKLGVKIIRTLGSGSFIGLPGDVLCLGESVLKDFVIDVKSEQELLTTKVLEYFQKNKEDAEHKMAILELYVGAIQGGDAKAFILISRDDFARVLVELDGYRKNDVA